MKSLQQSNVALEHSKKYPIYQCGSINGGFPANHVNPKFPPHNNHDVLHPITNPMDIVMYIIPPNGKIWYHLLANIDPAN
jgi:hypothetical protein